MSTNVTKDGIEVKVGQIWRDLDKRMNRYCRVVSIDGDKAVMQQCTALGRGITHKVNRVLIRRMHRSSTGWSLVV